MRTAAYIRLGDKDISAKHLDATAVALIVRFGLNDRDPSVKSACKDLILKFVADFNNDVPKFLRFMDFEMNEEEAEAVSFALMEMVEKGENHVSHALSVSVRQDGPNWAEMNGNVSKLSPSEILWAFNRCDYARRHMSVTAAAAFVDALVPDMVTLGGMLQDARKPALYRCASDPPGCAPPGASRPITPTAISALHRCAFPTPSECLRRAVRQVAKHQ